MYRFSSIMMLVPLFSVLPLSAWLMLLASTLLGMVMKPASAKYQPATR